MYDYFLGGKDNFAADRAAAEQALKVVPRGEELAQANRRFLVRAVRDMADEGISQYIDLGTGIPTHPAVHDAAREIIPGCRVLYVDNDPVVVRHAQALLATGEGIAAISGDIRHPEAIVSHHKTRELIDFARPLGVLFVAVLHFVEHPDRAVEAFRDRMAPGSMLAISHICSDRTPAGVRDTIEQAYAPADAAVTFRSQEEIAALFGGLPLTGPGLAEVGYWWDQGPRPDWALDWRAGVARKPRLTAVTPRAAGRPGAAHHSHVPACRCLLPGGPCHYALPARSAGNTHPACPSRAERHRPRR